MAEHIELTHLSAMRGTLSKYLHNKNKLYSAQLNPVKQAMTLAEAATSVYLYVPSSCGEISLTSNPQNHDTFYRPPEPGLI